MGTRREEDIQVLVGPTIARLFNGHYDILSLAHITSLCFYAELWMYNILHNWTDNNDTSRAHS